MLKFTRDFAVELARRVRQEQPFIQAVIGPRQVGKTTGVMSLEHELKQPYLYCSADLPVPPGYEWLRERWLAARADSEGRTGILVLDEVQKIAGWSEVVKSLFDDERRRKNPLQVIILGSASWTVQSGLTESLAGRYEILRVPHWDFFECQQAFGWDLPTFLKFGGYPAPATLILEVQRWQQFIRDSIVEPMISRDLFSLREVAKPALFRQALQLALRYPAQEISLQKLLGQLQDRGNSTTIKGYLELLEAGSVLTLLHKFSTRPLSVKSSSPKIIPMCSALLHAFTEPERYDSDPDWRGRVFEAAIGAKLVNNQLGYTLNYWRDGDHEVDFVLAREKEILAVEVKSGRKKRVGGISAFCKHFPKSNGIIVDMEIGQKLLIAKDPWATIHSLLK